MKFTKILILLRSTVCCSALVKFDQFCHKQLADECGENNFKDFLITPQITQME